MQNVKSETGDIFSINLLALERIFDRLVSVVH